MTEKILSIDHLIRLYSRFTNQPVFMQADRLDKFLSRIEYMVRLSAGGKEIDVSSFFMFYDDDRQKVKYTVQDGVAVIPVKGPLTNWDESDWEVRHGYVASYKAILSARHDAEKDSAVQAVAYQIDSPGGEGVGLFDAMEELMSMRGKGKKTYALVDDDAFSAAMGIASTADQIWISRSGRVGSIGSIIMHRDVSAMLEQHGIKYEAFTYGKKKAQFAAFKPLTDEAKAEIQAMVDTHGREFTELTAKGLNQSFESIKSLEAGVIIGQEAIKAGLAHKIVPFSKAIAEIKSQNNVPSKSSKGVKNTMDMEKFKSEHADLYQQIVNETKASMKEQVKTEVRAELETQIRQEMNGGGNTELKGEMDRLKSLVDEQGKQLAAYAKQEEKREAMRIMGEMKSTADDLWNKALAKSDIPEGFHAKVKKQVAYKDHLAEDGTLDREKFAAAVEAEIKDWEALNTGSTEILGMGAAGSNAGEAGAADVKKRAGSLLELAGQKAGE